jgi:hypothetical protein
MYVALRVIVPKAFPIPLHGIIMYLLLLFSDTLYQPQDFFLFWKTQCIGRTDFLACPAKDDAIIRVFDDKFFLFLVVLEYAMGTKSEALRISIAMIAFLFVDSGIPRNLATWHSHVRFFCHA